MKIVHIEDFFHPDAGYQINVLAKYQARAGHEVIIVTSEIDKIPDYLTAFFGKDNIDEKDKLYEERYNVKIIRYPLYCYVSGRSIFKYGFKRFIDSLNPDLLFVHGDSTPVALEFILCFDKVKYAVVFDSHMLKMAAVNPLSDWHDLFFRTFFAPKVKEHKMVFIRTQDDEYVQRYLGIPLEQAPFISHATDQLLFYFDKYKRNSVRKEIGIENDEFVVIYAGKLVESKGANLLADAFFEKFDCTNKKITLLVVGNTDGEYGQKLEEKFRTSKNKIVRVPTQVYTKLADYYCAADLAVFPKQCSLSFYDVQACGLPVISEDNNINVDRLSHSNGICFRQDDVDDFRIKLTSFFNMNEEEFKRIKYNSINYVSESYSYDKVYEKYEEVIQSEWRRQILYKSRQ